VHFAAGVPLKVIEAAAAGVPVVGTRLMAEQLLWEHSTDIMAADEPEAFCRACLALHEDKAAWTAMQQAAQARVRAEYGVEAFTERMRAILEPPA
jgi:glycosyltransferase involved in cell wall biosynthesis